MYKQFYLITARKCSTFTGTAAFRSQANVSYKKTNMFLPSAVIPFKAILYYHYYLYLQENQNVQLYTNAYTTRASDA